MSAGHGEQLWTYRQTAAWLGWGDTAAAGRKLKRRVLARERALRRRIAVRLDGAKAPKHRLTRSLVMRYLPELRRSIVDELSSSLKSYLDEIDERIEDRTAAYVSEHVDPRLEQLWERDERIAKAVDELKMRVRRLVEKR